MQKQPMLPCAGYGRLEQGRTPSGQLQLQATEALPGNDAADQTCGQAGP